MPLRCHAVLLTITTTHRPATDLGYLLHKHPDARRRRFELAVRRRRTSSTRRRATSAAPRRCCSRSTRSASSAAAAAAERRSRSAQYVNDRPVRRVVVPQRRARARSSGRALAGPLQGAARARRHRRSRSRSRTRGAAVPRRRGARCAGCSSRSGYEVAATRRPLDATFPDWGDEPLLRVTLTGDAAARATLLRPPLRAAPGARRRQALLGRRRRGRQAAPARRGLAAPRTPSASSSRAATSSTSAGSDARARSPGFATRSTTPTPTSEPEDAEEAALERPLASTSSASTRSLAALRARGARRVLDLGCGEGRCCARSPREPAFDGARRRRRVRTARSRWPQRRLQLDRCPSGSARASALLHGSLTYRDRAPRRLRRRGARRGHRAPRPAAPGRPSSAIVFASRAPAAPSS